MTIVQSNGRYTSQASEEERETQLISKLTRLYMTARNAKRKYYDTWRRNYRILNNQQWADLRPSSWQPTPTDSEIYPILSSTIAWMTDQEVNFTYSPAADPHSPYANFLNLLCLDLQAVMQTNFHEENYDSAILLSLWDAALYGAGVRKSVWDPGATLGLGNAVLKRVDPWSFYPDPHATSEDDSNYFIEVRRMSYDELVRRFPYAYDRIREAGHLISSGDSYADQKPQLFSEIGNEPYVNLGALPASGTLGSLGSSSVPSYGMPGQSRLTVFEQTPIVVYECWLRENFVEPYDKKIHGGNPSIEPPDVVVSDRWRVVVHTGNVILMDEFADELWDHGRHPYSRFVYDDIGEFWGLCLVSHLAPLQTSINRLLASLQQNAELIGNPIFLDPTDSGISRQVIVNRPGQRLSTSSKSNPQNQPRWLSPPNMPTFIQELIQFYISRMENISGLSGASKGSTPPPRTPAASVASSQESGFVRIRQAMRNLERSLRTDASLLSNLVVENYTTPRYVAILGTQEEKNSLSLAARHFYAPSRDGTVPMRFVCIVDAGASNPTSRQARIAEADTLRAMGVIDNQATLEAHNYPGAQKIVQRMLEQAQAQAEMEKMFGGGKRVHAGRTT